VFLRLTEVIAPAAAPIFAAPITRKGARRSAVGNRRHCTDRSGVFARGAATVASGVNAPEARPSASAATGPPQGTQPGGTAMMAPSRSPWWSDVRRPVPGRALSVAATGGGRMGDNGRRSQTAN
jgi:hypothetical protein